MSDSYPPLIQGFIDIQRKYPSFVIMTEVGGFFEIWQLDELGIGHAERASQILDIVLTRRDKSKVDSPKMAGFPSYAVNGYIKKLVTAGETVVVVRQEITGKKSDNNKNVKRYVERIVSPATAIDVSQAEKPNYFACCYQDEGNVGLALIDLSTGYVSVSEMSLQDVKGYLETVAPVEVLFNSEPFISGTRDQIFHVLESPIKRQSSAGAILSNVYELDNPTSNHTMALTLLGLELWPLGSLSVANLLNFLSDYSPLLLKKLSRPKVSQLESSLYLSKNAFLSLDIFESPLQTDQGKTLYGTLDKCKTAMGRRVLRRWLQQPLTDLEAIQSRLDTTEKMMKASTFHERLADVYDLSRLVRRMTLSSIEPHELPGFYNSITISLESLPEWQHADRIQEATEYLQTNLDIGSMSTLAANYHNAYRGPLRERILDAEVAWKTAKEKLDAETTRISAALETNKLRTNDRQDSSTLTGPKGLAEKCKAAGIDFKLKASDLQITDSTWEAAAFAELASRSALASIAKALWTELQQAFSTQFGSILLDFAEAIGELDVLSTFARISCERGYSRPKFVDSTTAKAKFLRMRHPVLELSNDSFESFVPNDVDLGEKSILVIYGANSAGKSTVLKGLALNIVMAQLGCFVAASEAELTVFESIMTRMTTFDSLSEGLSTFTMEMVELQAALKRADEKSLFLFDEIGRGTSVEDGEAIAFATLEYLNSNPVQAITLFATHYHSLFDSIKAFEKLTVKHFDCEVAGSNLVFTRELKDGPGNGSYGLAVAKTCGVPESIIRVGQNYKKKFGKLVVSRYNSKVQGSLCELCRQHEAQETHHIQDQLQGKVKTITVSGTERSINDEQNLVLLCGTCHRKVTKNKLVVSKRRVTGSEKFIVEIQNEAED